MIKKYFRVTREQKDLEDKIESKIKGLAKETGQTIVKHLAGGKLTVVGIYFSSDYDYNGKWVTSPLCASNDMPDTVEEAVENTKEMFKAKKEWEELLVKINEVLAE